MSPPRKQDLTADFDAEPDLSASFDAEPEASGPTPPPRAPGAPQGGALDARTGLGAGVRGFGQGASYGFADELGGAGAAVGAPLAMKLADYFAKTTLGRAVTRAVLGDKAAGLPDEAVDAIGEAARGATRQEYGGTPLEAYKKQRDFLRADAKVSEKEKPAQFYGGMVGGSIATPGFKAQAPKHVRELAHFVPGFVSGGIGAVGGSEREYIADDGSTNITRNAVKDFVPGGLVGGTAATVAGVGLEKGIPLAQRLAKRFSEDASLKAMGLRAGISNMLRNMGYKTADEGRELGRAALDEGVIPWAGGAETVRRRAETAIPQRHALTEGILQDANAAVDADRAARAAMRAAQGNQKAATNILNQPLFDFGKMAQSAGEALRENQPLGLTSTAERGTRGAQRLVDDIWKELSRSVDEGPAGFDFLRANKLKQDAQKGINYGVNATSLSTDAERRVAGAMRQSIEDQAANALNDPTMADALRLNNRRTGALMDIEALAADESQRQAARKGVGMMGTALTTGAALGGHQVGGLMGGAAAGGLVLGSKLLAPYLPAPMARGLDAAQQALRWFTPHARRAAPYVGKGAAISTGISRAAQKPEPEEEDRNAFIKGNGG